MFAQITIDGRYEGPPGITNGGWIAGLMSQFVAAPTVTVSLRRPVPVETPVSVVPAGEGATLVGGGEELVLANGGGWDAQIPAVEPIALADAEWATAQFWAAAEEHPFPHCFSCGPSRAVGDGLRLLPGAVAGRPELRAAPWKVDHEYDAGWGAAVAPAVWSALDCSGAFPHLRPCEAPVLGRMTGRLLGDVRPGETYVVVGRADGADGRKRYSSTALFDGDGRRLAESQQTWIMLDRPSLT
jgi:hypothetical protein